MKLDFGEKNARQKARLERMIAGGKISHAFIFEGGSKPDKRQVAISFAKGILCPRALGENCGQCSICDKIDHGNHEDLLFVEREKASLGIEKIKKLQEELGFRPTGSRHIAILCDGDLMTQEAQNRLLKTLEEPPGDSVLIILSENTENLLPTVRSRCIRIHLEMEGSTEEEEMQRKAKAILDMAESNAAYYRLKSEADILSGSREELLELMEAMERELEKKYLPGDGVPYPVDRIKEDVYSVEEAKRKLRQGMTPGYVLREMLLRIGG